MDDCSGFPRHTAQHFHSAEPAVANNHFRRPAPQPFTAAQRSTTTLLYGGLTLKHEQLLKACLENLGYRCEHLPTPDLASLQTGKEYSNNGQCNPTYFTVGNLVKYLQGLHEAGRSRQEIIDNYVFLTAGSCGPCRFGMYEAEYNNALQNAGFGGFRVLLFQQTEGYDADLLEAGLQTNFDFYLSIIHSVLLGDLLNEVGYQIRPFELEQGATDRALEQCAEILYQAIRNRREEPENSRWMAALGSVPLLGELLKTHRKLNRFLSSPHIVSALEQCRDILSQIKVDRTQVKPVVQITGEFWAQLAEGDGNFNMFRFLEGEGAEVRINPVSTWLLYVFWDIKAGYRERFGLKGNRNPLRYLYRMAAITLGEKLFLRTYTRLGNALGGTIKEPVPLDELERLGHRYYHSRITGGEGHLEVAKSIHAVQFHECHMILSLKPFGCMPSTQSDGVMAQVVSDFPEMIFLPIETAGEGEINAHSRVQMALGEARRRAVAEFDTALQATGRGLPEIKDYLDRHPQLNTTLYKTPPGSQLAGSAANFITGIARQMDQQP
ncbi:MAG TPA: activator of (R)-2-hydroxyglutaryl-CoA dehydratase [Gammaproteobacteria bacterium]|nr:activator of (R)-2-hydroxyglutaryl-CoA dehydratase [Gammaproteobacteria bacterium]